MCGDKSTPTFSAEVEITSSRRECRIESDGLRLHKDFDKFESLAQLVEHLTFNQDVSGSIPEWFIILTDTEFAELTESVKCRIANPRSP